MPSLPPPGRGIEKRSPQNSEQIKLMAFEIVATVFAFPYFFGMSVLLFQAHNAFVFQKLDVKSALNGTVTEAFFNGIVFCV